ncbi:hypothetical protein HDE_13377 [Halotydeus destructor]|nr:hypothetical protein HDE_13377 [Halotydeus destructor]
MKIDECSNEPRTRRRFNGDVKFYESLGYTFSEHQRNRLSKEAKKEYLETLKGEIEAHEASKKQLKTRNPEHDAIEQDLVSLMNRSILGKARHDLDGRLSRQAHRMTDVTAHHFLTWSRIWEEEERRRKRRLLGQGGRRMAARENVSSSTEF